MFDVSRYDVHKTDPVAAIIDGGLVYGELSRNGCVFVLIIFFIRPE